LVEGLTVGADALVRGLVEREALGVGADHGVGALDDLAGVTHTGAVDADERPRTDDACARIGDAVASAALLASLTAHRIAEVGQADAVDAELVRGAAHLGTAPDALAEAAVLGRRAGDEVADVQGALSFDAD